MSAGTERDRLLGAMGELYAELDDGRTPGGEELPAAAAAAGGRAYVAMLSEEEEGLVAEIGEALAKIASAASGARPEGSAPLPSAIVGALGGAEMVMRGEILAGRADRLPQLLPGFTFLVTLPFVGEKEALRLSRRTEELLGGAGEG